MAAQTFSTLWKALVGAFLALFAFLGLAAAPAQAAAPATPAPQPRDLPCEESGPQGFAVATALFGPPLVQGRSLPPTMKQRIRAEQHGSSPSCRQLLVPLDQPYAAGPAPHCPPPARHSAHPVRQPRPCPPPRRPSPPRRPPR
ncbi:DUF6344 domain-containing protein, partial [Streptomyces sp. SID11385]|uniref:DUF6344 domain-containing protein n=1 Tax=Streptomyces sp. SID11385 TaxID=2706031 RepID=UPI0031BAE0B2